MKKLVFIFSAMAVLFTFNLTSAQDNDTPAAVREIDKNYSLINMECQKIIGRPMIPSDAQRSVIEITTEELMLRPGAYWLFGKEKKFQSGCLEKTTFLSIPPGVYVLYVLSEKPPEIEVVKKRGANRP